MNLDPDVTKYFIHFQFRVGFNPKFKIMVGSGNTFLRSGFSQTLLDSEN